MALSLALWVPSGLAAEKKNQANESAKPGEYIRVEILGQLKSGIVAIGGETTGTTVTANGITWELDFAEKASGEEAAKMNGKTVLVRGTLKRRAGVEIKQRWIVTVSELLGAEQLAEVITTQMEALAKGVQVFYVQHRKPPKTLDALVQDPGGLRRKWRPLLESKAIPKDPWGNDYKYSFSNETFSFEIVSAGPDRKLDTRDDIRINRRF